MFAPLQRSNQDIMKITFYFSNDLSFTYRVNETKTAHSWLEMMSKVTPKNMLRQKENHRHGFANQKDIDINIQRLTDFCQKINMPTVNLATSKWLDCQKNLNTIHVEFPKKLQSGINDQVAHSCNLLIHWLEYELANSLNNAEQYLFNLDFNHQPDIYAMLKPIPKQELNQFTTDIKFGTLNLHYIYIGRHFFEMFNARDFICLQEQFTPQWHFNPTCALNFSEAQCQSELYNAMHNYYETRGGQHFFRLPFEDPRMAKGFFKLGEVENLSQYTLTERQSFRKMLSTAYVSNWEIEK